jgi:hypothetical protein
LRKIVDRDFVESVAAYKVACGTVIDDRNAYS